MKMRTSELKGAALDWAVAKCELLIGQNYTLAIDKDIDETLRVNFGGVYPEWSTDWQEGGAIIAREKINLVYRHDRWHWETYIKHSGSAVGNTPLTAAMRCYVASKLGDEVEIPEELMP